jgi:hypothetical protein
VKPGKLRLTRRCILQQGRGLVNASMVEFELDAPGRRFQVGVG